MKVYLERQKFIGPNLRKFDFVIDIVESFFGEPNSFRALSVDLKENCRSCTRVYYSEGVQFCQYLSVHNFKHSLKIY